MKKLISLALAVMIAVLALPGMALADSGFAGKCGANVTYSFDATSGSLVISGSGDMDNMKSPNLSPWYGVRSGIKSITIQNGVTNVGDRVFSDCDNLTSVTIPDSVTSIGDWAFSYCDNLITITIPGSVTSIGYEAFSFCVGLTSVTISDGVASIGEKSFSYCDNLITITIPDSVASIGDGAFSNCSNLTTITIPDSVTYISNGTFSSCDNLTTITIPDSVTSIGSCVFSFCINLKDIYYYGNSESVINELRSYSNATLHIGVPIKVVLNGNEIKFDQKPVIENGRTLVPLRAIFEALGADVDWDDATRTVTSVKGNTTVELAIDSTEMKINGAVKVIDVPAQIVNSRTLVPVRAISESFDCLVDWDGNTRTVVIETL